MSARGEFPGLAFERSVMGRPSGPATRPRPVPVRRYAAKTVTCQQRSGPGARQPPAAGQLLCPQALLRAGPIVTGTSHLSRQSFVLQALSEFRLRAPDDVSVVGFDDVPVAAWATPALTTVRQPLAAMAATAFRMLRASETAATQAHHVELATTLVVRDSTAPPPARR